MNTLRKVTAWITIVIIIGLIICTVVSAVTGSQYFFGFLALSLIVPVVLWVFMWFTKLVNKKENE
ncbi:MAG: hypothetical protein E7264_10870 [Lachnospiraceae bacterium]|nr:hypothetical protein [Lachnospiraceae bacterium]